ncbi:hypothetical protein [Pontibacter ruber]|uniref:Uncharacterized protein n=1 Tax=Pontibacter ruber TaxID=1343895 RepID=A0ABW5CTV3_9BACT|nr:hypothetical protein [Pontibacter ruber]
MEILNWKSKGWTGRDVELFTADQPVGKLTFEGWSGYDSNYTTGNTIISFKSKSWFDQSISIQYNGEEVGTASVSSLTGKAKLHLLTGELYTMKCSPFSYNRTVQGAAGETLISFKQRTWGRNKGTIEVADNLPDLTKEVLVSTSLHLKAVAEQQVAIMVAIFMPIVVNFLNR